MVTVVTESGSVLKLGQRISRTDKGWIRLDKVEERFFGAVVTYTTSKGSKTIRLPVTYLATGRYFSRTIVVKD